MLCQRQKNLPLTGAAELIVRREILQILTAVILIAEERKGKTRLKQRCDSKTALFMDRMASAKPNETPGLCVTLI